MNKKTVKDVDVKGKKVLVRCDFNVPMQDGVITDENRIIGALPTIKYLMEQGAKVVLCSHMGKPHNVFDEKLELNKKEKAKVAALPESEQASATAEMLEKAKKDVKKLTLAPVAARLNELLDGKVTFATDVIGDDAKAKVAACKAGECVLLENLRFHKGEEKKFPEFMQALQRNLYFVLHKVPFTRCSISKLTHTDAIRSNKVEMCYIAHQFTWRFQIHIT